MTQLRAAIYIALMFCIPLLVAGCLEFEGRSVSLDLNKNIATATYYGLGSGEKEEAKIEDDFQDLIKILNDCRSDKSGMCLSAELFPEGNKLNGKMVFRFNEAFLTAESLREYELEVDETGYFISLPDSYQDVVKGNGEIVQEGSKKKMKWPKTVKLIQYDMRKPAGFKDDRKIANLLPRWKNWTSQKHTGGANSVVSEINIVTDSDGGLTITDKYSKGSRSKPTKNNMPGSDEVNQHHLMSGLQQENPKMVEKAMAIEIAEPHIPASIKGEIDRLSSDDCMGRLYAVRRLGAMGKRAAPAIPALIRALKEYSLPVSDCGCAYTALRVLAKLGQPAIKPLIQALSDPEDIVNARAIEALYKIGKPAVKALIDAFQQGTDPATRMNAAQVLVMLKEKQVLPTLISVLEKDPLPTVRSASARLLGELNDTRAVQPLTLVIQNKTEVWYVRDSALRALLKIKGERTVQKVLSSLGEESDPAFKKTVATMLVQPQPDDNRTIEQLVAGLNDKDSSVRISSLQGLASKNDTVSREALIAALQNPNEDVRGSAIAHLGIVRERRAIEPLIRLLQDKNWNISLVAVIALGQLKAVQAVEPLMEMYKAKRTDEHSDGKTTLLQALGQIGDKRAVRLIMTAATEKNDDGMQVKRAAVTALGEIKDDQSIGLLVDIMSGKIPGPAGEAKIALEKFGESAVLPLILSLRGFESYNNTFQLGVIAVITAIGKPAVEPLIKVLEGEYRKDLENTFVNARPVKSNYPVLKQSAAMALGLIKDSRAVMPLIKSLKSPDMGSESTEALRMIGEPSVKPLIAMLGTPEPQHRMYIVKALGAMQNDQATVPLLKALKDSDSHVRISAAEALGKIKNTRVVKPLIKALQDTTIEPQYKMYIVMVLGETHNELALAPLLKALEDSDSNVRISAAEALGKIKNTQVARPLIRALKDNASGVRCNAAGALGKIKEKTAVEPLLKLLKTDPESRSCTIKALGQIKDKRATKAIIPYLKDVNKAVRETAVLALAELEDKRGIDALIETLGDKDHTVRWSAVSALRKISKLDFDDDQDEWKRWRKL